MLVLAASGDVPVVDAGATDAVRGVDASRDAGTADAQAGDMARLCPVRDVDGDGVDSVACGGTDCDDAYAILFPASSEFCDAADYDEDCNAFTFDALAAETSAPLLALHRVGPSSGSAAKIGSKKRTITMSSTNVPSARRTKR